MREVQIAVLGGVSLEWFKLRKSGSGKERKGGGVK
jgi:hypothetical protein